MSHLRYVALNVVVCFLTIGRQTAAQQTVELFAGRELFERVWDARPAEPGKLGPLFNERSCVACHRLGAIGGAGLNARNVQLVSVEVPDRLRPSGADGDLKLHSDGQRLELNRLVSRVRKIHSGLDSGSTVLHAYGTDSRYAVLRDQVIGLRPTDLKLSPFAVPAARPPYVGPIRRVAHDGVTLLVSERNSTAMFGAGLIDRIDVTDIKQAADEQAAKHPEIKGRFLGRFGWRGQTLDLRSFVAGACSVELGLDVPGSLPTPSRGAPTVVIRQTALFNAGGIRPRYAGPELDETEFSSLVAFVASLPAPGRRKPVDADQATRIRHGEAVFEAVQCGVCHRPTLGKVTGLYSDLLLHDLGPGLYDPQPSPSIIRSVQYYDSGPTLGDYVGNRPYEWRTPPLWGLADSGPYLHDGRALTIAEAILSHGGQAESSVRRFQELSDPDRRALLTFLSSLVAPDADYLKKPLSEIAILPGMHPREKGTFEEASSKQLHAEQAAGARLRLASQAHERGEPDTARVWLESVVKDFPNTQAATEATAKLNPRPHSP